MNYYEVTYIDQELWPNKNILYTTLNDSEIFNLLSCFLSLSDLKMICIREVSHQETEYRIINSLLEFLDIYNAIPSKILPYINEKIYREILGCPQNFMHYDLPKTFEEFIIKNIIE